MNRFEKAKFQMMDLDEASKKKNIINNLHPIVKILTTIISQSNSAHPFEKPFGNRVGIANSYTCLFDNRNIYLVF